MAGEQEKEKIKKCPLCSGELKDGVTASTFFVGEKIIVIKDIPAEVCSECDEAYVKSSVAGNIENMLDKLEELHSELSVIHYKIA